MSMSHISTGPWGDLRLYLEELADADDVQRFVEEHPFGQLPITEREEPKLDLLCADSWWKGCVAFMAFVLQVLKVLSTCWVLFISLDNLFRLVLQRCRRVRIGKQFEEFWVWCATTVYVLQFIIKMWHGRTGNISFPFLRSNLFHVFALLSKERWRRPWPRSCSRSGGLVRAPEEQVPPQTGWTPEEHAPAQDCRRARQAQGLGRRLAALSDSCVESWGTCVSLNALVPDCGVVHQNFSFGQCRVKCWIW